MQPASSRRLAMLTIAAFVVAAAPSSFATPEIGPGGPLSGRDAPPADDPVWLEHVDGLLIRPTSGRSARDVPAAVEALARVEARLGRPVAGGYRRVVLDQELPVDEVERLAAELVRAGLARSAEPDHRAAPAVVPDDPLYWAQWHLHDRWPPGGTAHGIGVEDAWAVTTGSPDVVVAVLDTGSLDHPDIEARLVAGYDLVSDPARSGDLDGRDEDPTDEGDWITVDQCSPPSHTARRSSWHGLHVAGTIGASTDNGVGVAGVDQAARIQHVRVLGRCGGTSGDIADAIRWAAGGAVSGLPINATPAKVVNLSLGGPAACPSAVRDAIEAAVDLGTTVVVAAGNSGQTTPGFPADCAGVVSVAATSPLGDRASYSNYGSWVTIAAPGGEGGEVFDGYGGVASLHNSGAEAHDPDGWEYAYKVGTSMATPHVSGVVSLMLSVNPDLTPAEVRAIVTSTASAFPASPDWPEYECSSDPSDQAHCGAGIVDAGAAVAAAHVPPAVLSVTAGSDRQAQLSWEPSSSVGGPLTFEVHRQDGAGTACSTSGSPRHTTSSTTFVDTGLVHGQTYRYCVVTSTTSHTSVPSNVVTVTATDTAAPAPPALAAAVTDGQVALTWNAVSDPTPPVTYRVYRSSGAGCSTASQLAHTGTGTSATDASVSAGTSYRYCMTAADGAGNTSSRSNVVEVSVPAPSAPPTAPSLDVANGDRRVTLSWAAVSDPMPPVTYRVYRSTGSGCSTSSTLVHTGTGTTRVDAGLTHGTTYRYCMTATNAANRTSDRSNVRAVTARDLTAPVAPTPMASAGASHVSVSWPAVADPTGPVTYRLHRSTGKTCSTASPLVQQGTARSYLDRDVSTDVGYRYCVTATDGAGNTSRSGATAWATRPGRCDARALSGDWDGSGRSGQGWWCEGRTRLLTAAGELHEFHYGRPGDVPVVADWNGDGIDTVSIIRDGTWHVNDRLRGGAAERTFVYGRVTRGDVPVAGSWDARTRSLPGIVRDREWHLRSSQSGGVATWRFVYGRLTRGDLPLWGDWNGDGRDTVGIVRTGTWHLRDQLAGGPADRSYVYGRVLAGDQPTVGDWNGDGKDTPAIVRGSDWHLRHVHAGGKADRLVHLPPP